MCAGRLGAFGDPPEIVVSGVNPGCNTGRAILHSGTVGAALTAQSFGCSALAVSVDVSDPWRFDTAAQVALDVLPMLLAAPARSVLNLNVPALAYEAVTEVRWARLAAFGSVRAAVAGSDAGRLQFELRATGVAAPADSDQGLVDAGFASLTTIVGVAEAWPAEFGADERWRRHRGAVVGGRSRLDRSRRSTPCPMRRRRARCTARCMPARFRRPNSPSSAGAPRCRWRCA